MISTFRAGLGVAAVALLLNVPVAMANEDSGLLLGFGAGKLDYDVDVPAGFEGVLTDGDKTTAWKGFVGWRFNRYLTLEVAYIDAGSVDISGIEGVSARLTGNVVQGSAVGTYWFNEVFGLHGRAGANMYDAKIVVSDGFFSETFRDDGTEFGWGAGLSALLDNALVRLEYESIDFDDVNAGLIELSLGWRF